MAIRGSLAEASLPDVVQLLAMGKKSGRLGLKSRQNAGFIFFENGRVLHAFVQNRDLETEDSVYELFKWTFGSFTFEPDLAPDQSVERLSLDPQSLMLEGARRVDEWTLVEMAIPTFEMVFLLDRQKLLFSKLELTEDQQKLLSLFDGRRTVDALVAESGMSEFAVGKAIFGLLNAGFLVPIGKTQSEREVPEAKVREYKNLGAGFYQAGMLSEAQREFRHVSELRPEDPDGPFFLGLISLRQNAWSDAAGHFENALQGSSAKMAIYNNLSYAREREGELEKARLAMAQALTIGGHHDPIVQTGAAALALRSGDISDAKIAIETARSLWGNRRPSAAWFHYAATAAIEQEDWREAKKILDEGVELYPNSAVLLNNLAVAEVNLGNVSAALAAAERGLMTDNVSAQLFRNFGDALRLSGREDEALAAYRSAEAKDAF